MYSDNNSTSLYTKLETRALLVYIAINVVLYNAVAVGVEWRLLPYQTGTGVTTGLPYHSSTRESTVAFKVRQSLTAP
jgi:hypothetical protein